MIKLTSTVGLSTELENFLRALTTTRPTADALPMSTCLHVSMVVQLHSNFAATAPQQQDNLDQANKEALASATKDLKTKRGSTSTQTGSAMRTVLSLCQRCAKPQAPGRQLPSR